MSATSINFVNDLVSGSFVEKVTLYIPSFEVSKLSYLILILRKEKVLFFMFSFVGLIPSIS